MDFKEKSNCLLEETVPEGVEDGWKPDQETEDDTDDDMDVTVTGVDEHGKRLK